MAHHTGGVWAAALTPLNHDLSINTERLIAHAGWLLGNGCDGVALLGTTGEANSFSLEERLALIDAAGKAALPPEKIMIGVGCCATSDTVRLSAAALAAGYHNLLMLPPFFYKGAVVSETGIFEAYATTIDRLADPRARIFLYDIPPMTGLEMSVALLSRLKSAFPDVIAGVKDSSGNFDDMQQACDSISDFSVFAGTETYLLPILKAGGKGCISATANVTSGVLARVMQNWQQPGAEALQARATELRLTLQNYPATAALKAIMAVHSGHQDWLNLRPPLTLLTSAQEQTMVAQLQAIGFDPNTLDADLYLSQVPA